MILIADAEVDGCRVDVRLAGGRIAELGPMLRAGPGEQVVRAEGGALLPGLVDHHIHLFALAAAHRSVHCGPSSLADAVGLAAALRNALSDPDGWVRGVGYAESVAGDLDAAALDRMHAARPVRVQHRSGALWIVNSRAADLLRLDTAAHPGVERSGDGTATGRLWRADGWLRARLPPGRPPDLAAVGARLSAFGITAVTDATPDLDPASWAAFTVLPQRVQLLGAPLGTAVPQPLTAGPYKIVIADSDLPGLDELADRIRAAHAAGRPVAVHCVTREALVLLLAALELAGGRPGDRIEHAAIVPAQLCGELARRGLRVVTQPGFLADRGDDYLADVPAADLPDLYRAAGLAAAGVSVALSSDAPYGPLDPWAVLAAAAHRRTPSGAVAGLAERLAPRAALDGYLAAPADPGGRPRRVRVGAVADLALLDRPLRAALAGLPENPVRMTFHRGEPAS